MTEEQYLTAIEDASTAAALAEVQMVRAYRRMNGGTANVTKACDGYVTAAKPTGSL